METQVAGQRNPAGSSHRGSRSQGEASGEERRRKFINNGEQRKLRLQSIKDQGNETGRLEPRREGRKQVGARRLRGPRWPASTRIWPAERPRKVLRWAKKEKQKTNQVDKWPCNGGGTRGRIASRLSGVAMGRNPPEGQLGNFRMRLETRKRGRRGRGPENKHCGRKGPGRCLR